MTKPLRNWTTLSLLGYTLMVCAALGLLARHALLATGVVALAVQLVAVALMIWARLTFGLRSFRAVADPGSGLLVTTGPYRFLRHPIYAAVLYFVVAAAVSHSNPVNWLLILAAAAGIAVRINAEERLLTLRYPEYADYGLRTRRLVPFIW